MEATQGPVRRWMGKENVREIYKMEYYSAIKRIKSGHCDTMDGPRMHYAKWNKSDKDKYCVISLSSVQFSHSVMSDSLWTHGLQHARPPCPSPTLGVHSNSCPLSQWCHLTVSSSVVPFFSYLQFFPASSSFPMIWLFTSGGQSTGASASASVPPENIQGWFPLGLTSLLSPVYLCLSQKAIIFV